MDENQEIQHTIQELKYDAFISYRHSELDKFVAENLNVMLESYKLPKSIAKKQHMKKTRIERVFRDRDELPLTSNLEDPIIKALQNSEFLIVICSPRLKESAWCKKEIQTFIEMHGRDKVLAVLIEGEPEDSFPEELLFAQEKVTLDDGTETVITRQLEPLAADFRGKDKKEMKKVMKEEILRLLAPMFALNYDDLKQRHRERKLRRMLTGVSIFTVFSLFFGGYCASTAIRISHQNKMIADQANQLEEQNDNLKRKQAIALTKEAEELKNQDDIYGAIELALGAVTSYNGVELPITREGRQTLTDVMGVYDGAYCVQSICQEETPGIIESLTISASRKYALTYDESQFVTLFDVEKREKILEVGDVSPVPCGFLSDESFYYFTNDGNVVVHNIENDEKTELGLYIMDSQPTGIVCSLDGETLAIRNASGVTLFDVRTQKKVFFYPTEEEFLNTSLFVEQKYNELYFPRNEEFVCLSMDSKEEVFRGALPMGNVISCISNEQYAFVLTHDPTININGITYITAYDKATGNVVWQNEMVTTLGTGIYYGEKDQSLLVVAGHQSWMIDVDTGQTVQTVMTEGNGLYVNVGDMGGFYLYDSEGNCINVYKDIEEIDLTMNVLQCCDLSLLELGYKAYVGVPKGSNRLVFYGYRINPDLQPYDGELSTDVKMPKTLSKDIKKLAKKYKIKKQVYISSILEIKEHNLTICSYKNGKMEVYDYTTKELLQSYELSTSGEVAYCGDIGDTMFISQYGKGYIMDFEGNIYGTIRNFHGISSDKKMIVLEGRDEELNMTKCAIVPYEFDEIVKKAERYLSTH